MGDGTGIIALDPWLEPYRDALRYRHHKYQAARKQIDEAGGLIGPVTEGHRYYGFNRGERDGQPGLWYREWAPGAVALSLVGDFNAWERDRNPLTRDEFGVWSLFLPDAEYAGTLTHGSRLKVHVVAAGGGMDRIPAYARRVLGEGEPPHYVGQLWLPPEPYSFVHPFPHLPSGEGLRIYEAHVGMAQEEEGVGSFDAFRERILPRIADLGYNAVQLMAIQEHPYYGSFGYHVSSFYAVSSRFGTPEDLKALIDAAHGRGLLVFLDLVHSHSVKNLLEGLYRFDGTDYQYFHAGPRGEHVAWDSLIFDYARYEVRRFLLSNIRYWLEEYRFDGFRFDGVTSMMYLDHGLNKVFTSYGEYFGGNIDEDAVTYLQLANDVAHAVRSDVVCIAEDVSGMPGVARPVADGGIGFDYRLSMGVPDYWVKLLKERPDEQWDLTDLYHTLLNRRYGEKHIGYAESHDQSLVGDKTLAFRLMDQEMYWHMDRASQSHIVDRGIALHKMIRLITFALSGEGYLNFIGNEFGHPEWVDFPRQGNGFSYQHARRQWSLVDDPLLRYQDLNRFDRAMLSLDTRFHLLTDPLIGQLALHQDTLQLVFRRGPLVFVFNFHPTASYPDLRIPVPDAADYQVVLNTEALEFGGMGRCAEGMVYPLQTVPLYGRDQSIQIYLPSRSAQVLAPVSVVS